MKIERISDEQIKFILSKDDLAYHSLKLSDLSYGSEKMHILFREMMAQAMLEFDFNADVNTPLIVETVPLPNDSVMIVVTKAAAQEYIENRFNLLPKAKEERKYKKKSFIDAAAPAEVPDTPVSIFTFKTLDEVGAAALRLSGTFKGHNMVYKNQNRYFLILHNEDGQNKMDVLETVLNEYGQKHSTSSIYKMHLNEYGELIISDSAIEKLASVYE